MFCAALYVFVHYFWYPDFYAHLLKASNVYFATATGAILTGPFLSWIVYKKELIKDLIVIGILQLTLLLIGAHLLYAERPIFLVYSVDRFVVVTARAIEQNRISPLVVEDFLLQPSPLVVAAYLPKIKSIDQIMKVISGEGDIEYQPELYEPLEVQRPALYRSGMEWPSTEDVGDSKIIRAYPLVNPKGDDATILVNMIDLKPLNVIFRDPWGSR